MPGNFDQSIQSRFMKQFRWTIRVFNWLNCNRCPAPKHCTISILTICIYIGVACFRPQHFVIYHRFDRLSDSVRDSSLSSDFRSELQNSNIFAFCVFLRASAEDMINKQSENENGEEKSIDISSGSGSRRVLGLCLRALLCERHILLMPRSACDGV